MKQVIYLDVLIFLNMIITFLLLLAASSVMKQYPTAGRMVLACIVGGASSLIILAPEMGFLLSLTTKLLFSVIIVVCAYKPVSLAATAKAAAYFFIVSFIFAGIMLFASSLPGISLVSYNNGAVYMNFSFLSLVAACVICYIITTLLNRFSRHKGSHCEIYSAEIFLNNKSIKAPAIADSGNALKDPYTGRCVIVADKKMLGEILPESVKAYLKGDASEGIRLIPCRTVSGTALLPCFRADRIIIKSGNAEITAEKQLVAVSRESLTEIILPALLISERRKSDVSTGQYSYKADTQHIP